MTSSSASTEKNYFLFYVCNIICTPNTEDNFTAFVEIEVLIAVAKKRSVFWDITPCTPLKINRRFGEIFRLHFQVRRTNQTGS
jgi:hypothetical protein